MYHLNVRVAWHDNRWNGTICRDPGANSYCMDLERIRAERNDALEINLKGKSFSEIDAKSLPPCFTYAIAQSARSGVTVATLRSIDSPGPEELSCGLQ